MPIDGSPLEERDPSLSPLEGIAATRADIAGLMGLAVGVVIVVTLYVARAVLVPIALAVLLAFMLAPVVRLLRRAHLGRVPAVVVAMVLALGLILSLGALIGTQFNVLLSDLPHYATTIEQKIAGARALIIGEITDNLGGLGRRIEQAGSEPVLPIAKKAAGTPATTEPKPATVIVRQPDATPLEMAERILAPAISPLATTGIVFIVAIFILLQQADLRDRFIRLFGMQDLYRTTLALDDAATRLSRYLLTQLGLNAAFGVLIGAGLLVIGVPNPLLWGTLGALLRFVPYVGTFISASLPIALAASVDPGWSMAVWTASLFLVTEGVMGQFVDPLVYGMSTGLSPVSVVIAAIFWAWMWGPIGLILSMPLTVCLVVLGRHVKRLEFLDVLMGNRPALTPVESFYQRILANDPDEAQDQAESLLKDCALSTYYDNVAIKGLQMIAGDAERGVLSAPQLTRIRRAMARLIDDLDDYEDKLPASAKEQKTQTAGLEAMDLPAPMGAQAGRAAPTMLPTEKPSAATVLCISGRSNLDDLASQILMQLLAKNGLAARAEPFEAAARHTIASLDLTDVSIICIASLEISSNPSHLRYLVRRIRQRLPHVPILLGLFSLDEAAIDDRLRTAVAADLFVASMRDAVAACLSGAQTSKQAKPPATLLAKIV